jgi:hypothetical protein
MESRLSDRKLKPLPPDPFRHQNSAIAPLQVIDVEPDEAEWCLETVEELFEHLFVAPAAAKAKKARLDAKLQAAGKLPSK